MLMTLIEDTRRTDIKFFLFFFGSVTLGLVRGAYDTSLRAVTQRGSTSFGDEELALPPPSHQKDPLDFMVNHDST